MVTLEAAQAKADEREMDLILIAPEGKPPVCKIGDYGKLRYEIQKKERQSRKGSRTSSVMKELKLSPKISEHDYNVRKDHALEFLAKGHKVKATMVFRGREVTHPEIGRQILFRLAEEVKEKGAVENPPRPEGRSLYMVIAPK